MARDAIEKGFITVQFTVMHAIQAITAQLIVRGVIVGLFSISLTS